MEKYYFFDKRIIQPQGTKNFTTRAVKGIKDKENNPMFGEGFFENPPKLWEVRYDNAYPNVVYDPYEKIYRVYYTMVVKDEEMAGVPLEDRKNTRRVGTGKKTLALGYAESKDGIHWDKPSLELVDFEGSSKNNILLLHAHGTGVFFDYGEENPQKKYKLVTKVDYPDGRSFMAVSFSADGIHWEELIPWPKYNPKADAHNCVFRDSSDGKFKLITRLWKDGMRVASMCESEDFINWTQPTEILRGLDYENQVYSMPVFEHENIYFGLASIFHEGDRDSKDFDHLDIELTYATDLSRFNFTSFGDPIIPRGKGEYHDGEFDCGVIFASPPVEIDDKVYVYYMGGNGPHTEFRETSFGRAYFEKDKWIRFSPKCLGKTAEVMTSPVQFTGENLEILADDADDIEVALFAHHRDTKPLDGFSFENSKVIATEGKYLRVVFDNPFSTLESRNACIVIRTKTASLYAIRGDFVLKCGRC